MKITWLNHASFRIVGKNGTVYIDPWKLSGAKHDADLILVSHSHFDHCSKPDIEKISKASTVLVAPPDTIAELGYGQALRPGEELQIYPIDILAVPAYNVDKQFHPRSNDWTGWVISIDSTRIYYAGDTDLIPEMGELQNIDLALLPVGGTYTLAASQAVEACQTIGCKAAIPYHWGDIVGTEDDAKSFAQNAPCEVHLLKPGQTLEIT